MKFKKLILYDLEQKPLEKEFVDKLRNFTKEIKIVLAKGEYLNSLKIADLEGADALIMRIFDSLNDALFEKSNLKYIGAMHTDTSHFNKKLLGKNGITLTNIPKYSTESVAELTISALLNISRQTYDAMNFVKKGNWGFDKFLGCELKGKTLGIVGLGDIGKRVAELATCFGMNILYYSRSKKNVSYRFVDLDELLKQCDVVSLHCSLNESTKNLINNSNLKFMKPGSILLNPSRMELVNLNDLFQFCEQKKISTWFDELQDKSWRDKFGKLDNVYLTPDYGWMTKEAQEKVREITLQNIRLFLKQKE